VREEKEWQIQGFSKEMKLKIDEKLFEEHLSYWFRFRSIPWYRKRRIKGKNPEQTLNSAFNELKIEVKITLMNRGDNMSSYWLIEPK
jgi:hypothetical protein